MKSSDKDKNQELIILKYAKDNMTFKTKDIEILLDIKSARARKILSGILKAIGENKNRKYTLKMEL